MILPFVTKSDRAVRFREEAGPSSEWQAEFDRDQADGLFGIEALRPVITDNVQTDDEELRVRWVAAAQALRSSDT